jgi:hypothetical protein
MTSAPLSRLSLVLFRRLNGTCSVREKFENLIEIRDLEDPVQLWVYRTNDDFAIAFLKLGPYVQKQAEHLGGEESYSFKVKY